MTRVLLVARREITERLRSKAFIISNVVISVVIVGAILAPFLFGGDDDPVRVGVVPGEAGRVAALATAQQAGFDTELELVPVGDRDAAVAELRSGEIAVAILDATSVLVERSLHPRLESLLASAANAVQVDDALTAAGLTPEDRAALFAIEPLTTERLEEDAGGLDMGDMSIVVVYAAVFLLYGLLVLYGQWVAQGIVEEKQSRVVEVLLASLRPTELLAGKVLGLGVLGLAQIVLFAVIGVGGLLFTEVIEIPAASWGALAIVVPWYLLGYVLYATLFAMTGALVSRVEDMQSAIMPVVLLLVAALLVAQVALTDPGSRLAAVAGVVPFTAPIVQPMLIASGTASGVAVALSIAAAVALIAVLLPVSGRIYRGGVLRLRGRVSLREAARAARGASR